MVAEQNELYVFHCATLVTDSLVSQLIFSKHVGIYAHSNIFKHADPSTSTLGCSESLEVGLHLYPFLFLFVPEVAISAVSDKSTPLLSFLFIKWNVCFFFFFFTSCPERRRIEKQRRKEGVEGRI